MTILVLHPLDTFFFRDGRPYNQDDPGQVEAASLFPPHPPTVAGAVRAAVARAMGWPGAAWDTAALGDGVNWQAGDESLGRLRFSGPYILRNDEPIFPAPLNLVARKDEGSADLITYLAPIMTPMGSTSSMASLRLKGAALACFFQSGLKAICGRLR